MRVEVKIHNYYADGEVSASVEAISVPEVTSLDEVQEWADTHLAPLTGSGRRGEALYVVEILHAEQDALTGLAFEWAG